MIDFVISIVMFSNQSSHRRRLPLVASWTVASQSMLWNTTGVWKIKENNIDVLIHCARVMTRLPLYVTTWDIEQPVTLVSIANWFYMRRQYAVAYTILKRSDCPHPTNGPLVALVKGRRLPTASSATVWLMTFIRYIVDHSLISSSSSSSLALQARHLPLRLVAPPSMDSIGDRNRNEMEIGVLHALLYQLGREPLNAGNYMYRDMIRALLPHYSREYLNRSMLADPHQLYTIDEKSMEWYYKMTDTSPPHFDSDIKHTPWQLAALAGDAVTLSLLETAGCEPDEKWMHRNEVLFRQFYPHFQRDQIQQFEINSNSADNITQGAFGQVYTATRLDDKEEKKTLYIVKTVPLENQRLEHIAQEITCWSESHSVYAIGVDGTQVTVIMNKIPGETLDSYYKTLREHKDSILANEVTLTMDERGLMYLCTIGQWISSLIMAVHDINDNIGMLHRDVRPANIMLFRAPPSEEEDNTMEGPSSFPRVYPRVDLVDYGHATNIPITQVSPNVADASLVYAVDRFRDSKGRNDRYFYCVTAPEVINGGEYTQQSEIWSLGMILLSFWTCQHALDTVNLPDDVV
jgi:hypothetical protein